MGATSVKIESALLAVPVGHRHLRLAVKTDTGETLVFREADVAAVVRAYTTIKTHPQRRAVKLEMAKVDDAKDGYAGEQLIEAAVDAEVEKEITRLLM
ncbi:MAG TPA: hypothetical protein VGK71_10230 [Nitrospirota bacterium]